MQIELERKAYSKLLAWKNEPNHSTLEVSGARQVGKTYLVNKFADREYKKKNLCESSGTLRGNTGEPLQRSHSGHETGRTV